MTVSTDTAADLSVDVICRRAMQLIGLLEPSQGTDDHAWNSRAGMARDFLEIDVEALQAAGILVRAVDFYAITLIAGTSTYALPSTTLDVFGPGMVALTGASTQTPVELVDRNHYHRISDKTLTGRPTIYYPHRIGSITVYVWPVPTSSTVGTLTLQRHKVLATSRTGSATMDFERYWTDYFVWKLAYRLGLSAGLPLDRCAHFAQQAEAAKTEARKSSEQQRAPTFLQLDHPTGYE